MKQWMHFFLMLALAGTVACGDDDGDNGGGSVRDGAVDDGGDGDGDGDSDQDGGLDESDEDPLYAIMYEIYDGEDSNSYLAVLDSLDIDELTPERDRELAGGRAFLATYDGAIFVGAPETPTVTRFEVAEDGSLEEKGELSFANYGLTAGVIDAWTINFISPDKAYLFDPGQGTTIVWDPIAMEITGEIEAPDDFFRDGLSIDASPAQARGNRLYRSVSWANYESYGYAEDAVLAVYDTDSDELLELIPRTRCASVGNLSHRDEDDNLYFSNWIWPVAGTLLYDAPQNCVLRINAGEDDFDSDWELVYADAFDGREGAQFSYTADGEALVAIFNDDETSFDDETDPWDYAGRQVWSVHRIDLETQESTEIDIPRSSGAFTPVRLDGRQFLMVPTDTWEATDIFEIVGDRAERRLHIPGWSYQFVKVR